MFSSSGFSAALQSSLVLSFAFSESSLILWRPRGSILALQLGSSSEVKKGSSEAQHCKEEKKEGKERQTERKMDRQKGETGKRGTEKSVWHRNIVQPQY